MARANAPTLIVATPLIAAALAAASPNARLSWVVATLAALATAVLGVDLAMRVLVNGAALAPAPLLGLRADGAGAWAAALIALAGALAFVAMGAVLRTEFQRRTAPFALALGLCVIAGWSGAALARDLVTLVVAALAAWLSSVGFVGLTGDGSRGALSGAARMLTSGGVAAALMLLGVGFVFGGAGSLELGAIASGRIVAPPLAAAGLGLVLFGLALKAGVAPAHMWLGAAFGRASGAAALLLGAVGIVGALAAMTRLSVFALSAPAIAERISTALLAFGVASVLIGSAQAVGARNLRRLAAYAGVAQAGCVLVSASLGSPAGFAAALVLVSAQCAGALAMFGGAVGLGAARSLDVLDGLGRRAPISSAAMMAGALSLMGAPLTLGFLGRWRLIEAGVGGGWWWCAGAAIIASLAAVFYGGRVIERLYFRRAARPFDGGNWRRAALAPALLAAIAAIMIGLAPSSFLRSADAAIETMSGAAP